MSKVMTASVLAMLLLASGWLYRVVNGNNAVTRNNASSASQNSNPAFQAIFANAVSVTVYDINLYAYPSRGKTPLIVINSQSHPQQLRWFKATDQFRPDVLSQITDAGFIVHERDGTSHRLAYASGTLVCGDMPSETAPKGSATLNAQFIRWFESIKPHHKPPPYKKPSKSSTPSSRKSQ